MSTARDLSNNRLLTLGTSVASTSGTSIDFTSIPSWVKRITVMFNGVSTNGSSLPQIQIGTSGGVQTSGYTGCVWQSANTTATFSAGFLLNSVGNSVYVVDGLATLTLLNSSTGLWVYSVCLGNQSGAGISGGGSKTLSGTLDRVRITTVNGTDTFDSGSINILYE